VNPRYVARVNPKTGDFEVWDTLKDEPMDPRKCAERLNDLTETVEG
jgi:hypothetical protein